MDLLEIAITKLQAAVPVAEPRRVTNESPAAQHSMLVRREGLLQAAWVLRKDPELALDFCSNVTGVDWLERTVKVKATRLEGDTEKEVEESRVIPGYLEVVYHLYSMSRKHGPVVLRVRTGDRSGEVSLPSLTPVWRSCELQEREIFDLFGVRFEGHPDLRRLLMWEGFKDYPMRKDYVEPDDFEYEPTAHDEVLERARAHPFARGGA